MIEKKKEREGEEMVVIFRSYYQRVLRADLMYFLRDIKDYAVQRNDFASRRCASEIVDVSTVSSGRNDFASLPGRENLRAK